MRQVTRDEAQEHLAELLDAALDGEVVYIGGEGMALVRLLPVTTTAPRRRAGTARGLIHMADDFDDPLPEFEEYMR